MTRMVRSVLACVLFASSAAVWGDSIEQTFQFDCDVPAGKMSDWVGTIVPRVQQVAGSIELLEPREHERWWPVASVFLTEGTQQVGLQLYLERQAPDTLRVAVLRPKEQGGRSVITSVPWKGSPISFSLSVKESGDVELAIAGKSAQLGVKSVDAKRLSLSCSSAQFKFKDVRVRSERTQQSIAADMAAAANPPAALGELGKTLRQARSSPPESKVSCPRGLEDMAGISKSVLLAELGSPDMEESVHPRNAEPFLLLHYDLRPLQSSSENFTSVIFKLSPSNVLLSASCNQGAEHMQ